MSVSRSGSDSLSFADHDVHHIRHDLNFLASADSGPLTNAEDVQQFEITERGLDPDELAELKAMRVTATIGTVGDPINQDEIGQINAEVECGFNLQGDEFLLGGSASTSDIDVDGSGTADFRSVTRDTDEVGQLFHGRLHGYLGYSDTTDGTGGAAGMPVLNEMLMFDDLTSGGPIVDAVDDFSSRVFLDVNNVVASATAQVSYQLYYHVQESESGRTRFGR